MENIALARIKIVPNCLPPPIQIAVCLLMLSLGAAAQAPYQPKFSGDPARSQSEASALGYMRTVIRAQKLYEKKSGKYASSLAELVHTGNFTQRMLATDRGDYTVNFRAHEDGYELALTPKELDAEHRSFYTKEDGVIRAEESKAADENSPKLK